jgi:hypothetical protein
MPQCGRQFNMGSSVIGTRSLESAATGAKTSDTYCARGSDVHKDCDREGKQADEKQDHTLQDAAL